MRGVAAGLFVLALLPDAVEEEALVSAAAARGLVLGFANLSRGAIERGVAELRRALEMAV